MPSAHRHTHSISVSALTHQAPSINNPPSAPLTPSPSHTSPFHRKPTLTATSANRTGHDQTRGDQDRGDQDQGRPRHEATRTGATKTQGDQDRRRTRSPAKDDPISDQRWSMPSPIYDLPTRPHQWRSVTRHGGGGDGTTDFEVSPKEIPAPKNSDLPLNAYMLHNLAHVELNAIDLAWDTVVRFSPYSEILGEEFFADFAQVADDESRHFAWCSQRLAELGFKYGDMPAHNLLWRECEKSSDNVAARLAVIPLVQEARGLDALTSFYPCKDKG